MKKTILLTTTVAFLVTFLFLFSITFSAAHITIIAPLNTSNISSGNGSLVFFNITYVNATDLQDPINATIHLINSSGSSQVLGNISCPRDADAGSQGCEGSLNVTINQTGVRIDDGVYTINVTLANASARNVTQNWSFGIANMTTNITIDNTPPKVTDFNISLSKSSLGSVTGKDGLNFTSQVVFLNVTVNDTIQKYYNYTAPNVFVFFNFTNSAGTTNISLNGSNPIGDRWNASFNTSFIADGYYNVTVWANDSHNTWNNSEQRLSFTVDTTVPAITLTRDATLSDKDTIVINAAITDTVGVFNKCGSDRTDLIFIGEGTTTQVGTENSLTCGTTYAYKVSCTDHLGLAFETVATDFSTDACSGSSGGGGGGGSGGGAVKVISPGSTVSVKASEIASTYRAKFGNGAKISFEITPSAGISVQTHSLTVTRIGGNSATVVIASDPITLSVNVGEVKKVDVDHDGVFDLSVQLNAISSGRADLSVVKVEEASDGDTVSGGEEIPKDQRVDDAKGSDDAGEGGDSNLTVLWVALIVIIAIVVAVIVYYKKRR